MFQAVVCLKLMVKSQSWEWVQNTLLPRIFDKISTTTEFGLANLTGLLEQILSSELVHRKADTELLKTKLIPTFIGLLWTGKYSLSF